MISFVDTPVSSSPSMHTASGMKMTKSHLSEVKVHPKFSEDALNRARDFLRARYPTKTAEFVESDTGISHNTIGSWLKGLSAPGFWAMLVLIDAYGPDFLAAVLPRQAGWLAKAVRAERLALLEAEHERIGRELAEIRR